MPQNGDSLHPAKAEGESTSMQLVCAGLSGRRCPVKKRTIGSLTHADFGRRVEIAGHARGVLWSLHHVAAIGDIPEPWTRVTVQTDRGNSESTRGLPPDTVVVVHAAEVAEKASEHCWNCGTDNSKNGYGCCQATVMY